MNNLRSSATEAQLESAFEGVPKLEFKLALKLEIEFEFEFGFKFAKFNCLPNVVHK